MTAKDFILESSYELQEKSKDKKFWEDTELFIKLQRAYRNIQKDLPCFMESENISIKEGISLYHIKHTSIKEISLFINDKKYIEHEKEYIFRNINDEKLYNLTRKELLIYPIPKCDNSAVISYFYQKELLNDNDFITIPIEYEEALRLLYLAYVFEKAPKDMTQRDLSIHYLKRYQSAKEIINRTKKKRRALSNYQRI